MRGIILSHDSDPVLVWDADSMFCAVLDTEKVPSEIYDHLWCSSIHESNPEARENNNMRVIAKWIAVGTNSSPETVSRLMSEISDGKSSCEALLRFELKTPWSLSVAESDFAAEDFTF